MKKYLILSLLSIAAACNNAGNNKNDVDSTKLKAAAVIQPLDTLVMGDKTFLVYPLDKLSFQPVPPNEVNADSIEKAMLLRDSALVSFENDSLTFKLDNGQTTGLKNNKNDEGDDYAVYQYEGLLSDIGFFVLSGTYYEANDYVLVSKASGEFFHMRGEPVVSPDKKYILSPQCDLDAGFVPNGFELYRINNGKLELLGQADRDTWGPGKVKWVNPATIECEHIVIDSTHNEITTPVKLVMQ